MSIDGEFASQTSVSPQVTLGALPGARYALCGETMGTRYSAVFVAPVGMNTQRVELALRAGVDAVDRQMSNWKPDSDVSRLNAAELGVWVEVARNTLEVVEAGLEIGRRSGGAFDIGVGTAVNAWGFGPGTRQPDTNAIALLTGNPLSGTPLEIDRTSARIRKNGPVQLDLCGIAKGFGVDELARILDAFGIADYLVSIDGELRAGGVRIDGAPWRVAIERPNVSERSAAAEIGLADRAIATSGDYRHRRLHDGRVISHTIDPRTGLPLDNGLASVSVLAGNCMIADAWATALLVAGPVAGPDLAEANGLDALFILRQGNQLLALPIGAFC